ncbi:MAG: NAD-dependent malic enzyme [Candidatus Hydrogenedentes bacterium]|nr:NAD-dependent malic enzyme [Candidatus Hydrogenedentota bacterium]
MGGGAIVSNVPNGGTQTRRRVRTRGEAILHDPSLNKGTAFTEDERDILGIRGLLPPRVFTEEEQLVRVMSNYRRKTSNLDKYIFLIGLEDRNETLFYRALIDNIEEMMPIVYTPTVGEACKEFAHIWRRPRGMFISSRDRGRVAQILRNWPEADVRMIVVTDGERILGLGDLGADGMGIPIGKLSLYTACAGIHPTQCLPITLDVGTDNEELIKDPLYIGLRQKRVRGEEYDALLGEFVAAAHEVFPRAVLQFEDFGNRNAFRLLRQYRDQMCCFNDDIQGTAAVALAGIYSALRITGRTLLEQRFLFLGAGEAGIGIADLLVLAMVQAGLSLEEARRRCFFVDSKGLVVKSRTDLQDHKRRYAHEHPPAPDLLNAVTATKPTALIGVSGQPQTFTQPVIETMARINARPIIFALSNPTSKAECTALQAYSWSKGACIFACGSPFDPVEFEGRRFVPGQGNNAYIFPGLGLGVIASGGRRVTDEMFAISAQALANRVREEDLATGRVYPPLSEMRRTSLEIAKAVAKVAYAQDLASEPEPEDLESFIRAQMYEPTYQSYV